MDEEAIDDSLQYSKELENKIGRKMPECLHMWLRDAADCDTVRMSGEEGELRSGLSDGFSEKMGTLKREMTWLRSADVRILRQLVAVHEGIEAVRWLMEERDAVVSPDSSLTGSLTGSLSSLAAQGPPGAPFREDMSPSQGSSDEDSSEPRPPNDSDGSNFATQTEARARRLVAFSCASSGPANSSFSDASPQSQSANSSDTTVHGISSGCDTIRRALLRSKRGRGDVNVDNLFPRRKTPGEIKRDDEPQDSTGNTDTVENNEAILLGYDAQWCWVESQDDVTFL